MGFWNQARRTGYVRYSTNPGVFSRVRGRWFGSPVPAYTDPPVPGQTWYVRQMFAALDEGTPVTITAIGKHSDFCDCGQEDYDEVVIASPPRVEEYHLPLDNVDFYLERRRLPAGVNPDCPKVR